MPNKTNACDANKITEEKFREAACYGDEEAVRKLVERGVNISSQHDINGWSALHWAAKRGQSSIVSYLLSHGADKTLTSIRGETPIMLAENEEIRKMLGESSQGSGDDPSSPKALPITPHYLSHPPLGYKVDVGDGCPNEQPPEVRHHSSEENISQDELVVKVRVAQSPDPDFIEVDIPRTQLTFSKLLQTCCEELQVDSKKVAKLRKLPNTVLRKDKDVSRLNDFQELEVVLQSIQPAKSPPQSSSKTLNQKPSLSQPVGTITTNTSPLPPGYLSTRHSAPPNDQPYLEESEEGNLWEDSSINCLINCYRNAVPCLDSPTLNKEVWVTISEDMKRQGYNVNELQCENKWKSLPNVFERKRDSQNEQSKKNMHCNIEGKNDIIEPETAGSSNSSELHLQSVYTKETTSDSEAGSNSSGSGLNVDSLPPTETDHESAITIANTSGPHIHSLRTSETTSEAVTTDKVREGLYNESVCTSKNTTEAVASYSDSEALNDQPIYAAETTEPRVTDKRNSRPHIHSIYVAETTSETVTDSNSENSHIQPVCVAGTTSETQATDRNSGSMHVQPVYVAEVTPESVATDNNNGRPHIHSIYVAEATSEPVTANKNSGRPHIHSIYVAEGASERVATDNSNGRPHIHSIYVAETTSEPVDVSNRSDKPHIQSICAAQTEVDDENDGLQHVQAIYVAEATSELANNDERLHVASIYTTETATEPVTITNNSNELHIQSVYTLDGPSLILQTSLSPQPLLESSITIQTEGGDIETNLQDIKKIQSKGMKRKKRVSESHLQLLQERENAKERCHKMKLEAMQKSNELLEKLLATFESD